MSIDLQDTDYSALGSAASWINAVVQGPILTSLAMLAIAGAGFAMLGGRVSIKRGAIVVLGCFIAFGAGSIARAFADLAFDHQPVVEAALPAATLRELPQDTVPPPVPARVDGDPYAGASFRN